MKMQFTLICLKHTMAHNKYYMRLYWRRILTWIILSLSKYTIANLNALNFSLCFKSPLCLKQEKGPISVLFFLFAFTIKAEITSAGVIMIVNTNPNALMCCKPF